MRGERPRCGQQSFPAQETIRRFCKPRSTMTRPAPGSGLCASGESKEEVGWRDSWDRPCCRFDLRNVFLPCQTKHLVPRRRIEQHEKLDSKFARERSIVASSPFWRRWRWRCRLRPMNLPVRRRPLNPRYPPRRCGAARRQQRQRLALARSGHGSLAARVTPAVVNVTVTSKQDPAMMPHDQPGDHRTTTRCNLPPGCSSSAQLVSAKQFSFGQRHASAVRRLSTARAAASSFRPMATS